MKYHFRAYAYLQRPDLDSTDKIKGYLTAKHDASPIKDCLVRWELNADVEHSLVWHIGADIRASSQANAQRMFVMLFSLALWSSFIMGGSDG